MSKILVLFLLFAFVTSGDYAKGDGLLYILPEDGAWAKYRVDGSAIFNSANLTMSGDIQIASVGRIQEKDQYCRWIETAVNLRMKGEVQTISQKHTYKLLIPEKYLVEGNAPLDHVLRGWVQWENGEKVKAQNTKQLGISSSCLPFLLSSPWENTKHLDKIIIDSKIGKLDCAGIEGTFPLKEDTKIGKRSKLENRLHPKSPFGVVMGKWEFEDQNASSKWTVTLIEVGKNAKSIFSNDVGSQNDDATKNESHK